MPGVDRVDHREPGKSRAVWKPYVELFIANVLFSAFLEKFKHLWEPELTWLEVMAGVTMVGIAAQRRIDMGLPEHARTSPEAAARWTWMTVFWLFVTASIPVISWQIWRQVREQQAIRTEIRARHTQEG